MTGPPGIVLVAIAALAVAAGQGDRLGAALVSAPATWAERGLLAVLGALALRDLVRDVTTLL